MIWISPVLCGKPSRQGRPEKSAPRRMRCLTVMPGGDSKPARWIIRPIPAPDRLQSWGPGRKKSVRSGIGIRTAIPISGIMNFPMCQPFFIWKTARRSGSWKDAKWPKSPGSEPRISGFTAPAAVSRWTGGVPTDALCRTGRSIFRSNGR